MSDNSWLVLTWLVQRAHSDIFIKVLSHREDRNISHRSACPRFPREDERTARGENINYKSGIDWTLQGLAKVPGSWLLAGRNHSPIWTTGTEGQRLLQTLSLDPQPFEISKEECGVWKEGEMNIFLTCFFEEGLSTCYTRIHKKWVICCCFFLDKVSGFKKSQNKVLEPSLKIHCRTEFHLLQNKYDKYNDKKLIRPLPPSCTSVGFRFVAHATVMGLKGPIQPVSEMPMGVTWWTSRRGLLKWL